ncbi:Polysaccharide biosynthesis domain,Yst0336-like domain [Cinara cedri]|uniref:Polysaccharide biosynthesis domain,Yst0336-like domain n=1 Tax=Cinara cedri TaxID=506608 RepID=A0A5E4MZG3_9HEMI|nr:Polysaccharide biosynthesis domain,Yst0336-like domain [Cinara cedri]
MDNLSVANGIGTSELAVGASLLSRPGNEFGNDEKVEMLWAIKAFEHAEIYFNLICSVDPKLLKLTPHDDKIYNEFRRLFPDLQLDILDENDVKSDVSKIKWRRFSDLYKNMENYNVGTLIRKDIRGGYDDANSFIVVRIQFYAIELARNREGLNDVHFFVNNSDK